MTVKQLLVTMNEAYATDQGASERALARRPRPRSGSLFAHVANEFIFIYVSRPCWPASREQYEWIWEGERLFFSFLLQLQPS